MRRTDAVLRLTLRPICPSRDALVTNDILADWVNQGEVENKLIELGEQHSNVLEAFIMRPGIVLAKQAGYVLSNPVVGAVMGNVRIEDLVAVMVTTAISGNGRQTMEYSDLQAQGKSLLHSKG